MAPRRRKARRDDPLAAYRRVRKPMPPPARPDEDRRRRIGEEVAGREAREAEEDAGPDPSETHRGEHDDRGARE